MSVTTNEGLGGKIILTIHAANGRVMFHETVSKSDVEKIVARFFSTTIR